MLCIDWCSKQNKIKTTFVGITDGFGYIVETLLLNKFNLKKLESKTFKEVAVFF